MSDFSHLAKEGYINWIEVCGLADSETITKLISDFGFPPVDCKAVLTPLHAAKIDLTNGRLIIILRACYYSKRQHVSSEHLGILCRDNFIITFRELNDGNIFFPVENSISANVMNIRSGSRIMLIAFILNAVFSVSIETAVRVEEMLERLDDTLLDTQDNASSGKKSQQCRHANLILQKNNTPLRSEFRNLSENQAVTSDPAMMQIYDELSNQLDSIILSTRNSREMLASIRDMYAANNDYRMNFIMKRLTVVSTLFIPITFIVGLWGMNFKYMPELYLEYGYPIALIIIIITVIITWQYMRKHDWF